MIKQKVICLTLCILLLGLLTYNPLVVHATGPSDPVIGVYGINYYTAGNSLTWSIKNADDLYNTVKNGASGWHGAWDLHDWDVYPGEFHIGTDSHHINNVDLGYFSGHGQTWYICASPQQYNYAFAALCLWGGSDSGHVKWIGLSACLTGQNNDFRNAMNCLHELCTFNTYSYDVNPTMGGRWGYYITPPGPFPILDGWICAGRDVELSGTGMRVFYASGDDMDHLWGQGYVGPDPTGSTPVYSVTVYK